MTKGKDVVVVELLIEVVVEVRLSSKTRAPTSAYLIITAWELQFKIDPLAVLLEVMCEGGGLKRRKLWRAKA